MASRKLLPALLVLLVVLSGCSHLSDRNVEKIHIGNSDISYTQNYSYRDDKINTGSGLTLDGWVTTDAGTKYHYRNITMKFYTADGRLVHSEPVGSLGREFGSQPVSVNLSTTPAYITIESPDFWQHADGVHTVEYRCWDEAEQEYNSVLIYSPSDSFCGINQSALSSGNT